MDVRALQNCMISILRSALKETELESSVKNCMTAENVTALFSMSKEHDLAHVVSAALRENGVHTVSDAFVRQEMLAIYRHEQMTFELAEIEKILNDAQIPFVPLKGAILRNCYPQKVLRTSCDIDVLVPEQQLPKAVDAFCQKGYCAEGKNYHDVSLVSPSNVHVELHFSLCENVAKMDGVLQRAWEYATAQDGCRFAFNEEFFIYYTFAHLAYHFLAGGGGIRSLMDVWVMTHQMGMSLSQAEGLLKEGGLLCFATEISRLSEVCFSGTPEDEFSQQLLRYLWGGLYCNLNHQAALGRKDNSQTFGYAIKRVFVPFHDLALEYPVLKKAGILYPFCWAHRLVRLGKRRRQLKKAQRKAFNALSVEQRKEVRDIRARLEI